MKLTKRPELPDSEAGPSVYATYYKELAESYKEALDRARDYSEFDSWPCVLCYYDEGHFKGACNLHQQIDDLHQALKDRDEIDTETHKSEISGLESEISGLEFDLEDLQQEVDRLKSENWQLRSQIDILETTRPAPKLP